MTDQTSSDPTVDAPARARKPVVWLSAVIVLSVGCGVLTTSVIVQRASTDARIDRLTSALAKQKAGDQKIRSEIPKCRLAITDMVNVNSNLIDAVGYMPTIEQDELTGDYSSANSLIAKSTTSINLSNSSGKNVPSEIHGCNGK